MNDSLQNMFLKEQEKKKNERIIETLNSTMSDLKRISRIEEELTKQLNKIGIDFTEELRTFLLDNYVEGFEFVVVRENGNVGIGTTAPNSGIFTINNIND